MPVFAFTDIEGSTGLWEKHQEAMSPVIAKHYGILEHCVAKHGGSIIKKTGDGVFAIFPDPPEDKPAAALECALDLQQRFQAEAWPVIGELRVRMAFHCGEAELMGGDYYGPTANRTARLMSLGWGGQILVSEDLRKKARLPAGAEWTDLGLHQVKDLPEAQHLFGLLHPSLKLREFPALKSLSNRPHNLPPQWTPLAGRQEELKQLGALLTGPQARLVTLFGGGGMGKSRLAVEAALDNLEAFKHGACLVSLEAAAGGDLAGRIAEALKLGLYRQKDPKEQVLAYLKDKNLLLILDPCEKLGAAAALIPEILEACPGLRVLACSRFRLQLRGETIFQLGGMDDPSRAGEAWQATGAARLFLQQVQNFQPAYLFKAEDKPHFLKVFRLLQGMPLGIELAAGWMRLVPLKTLAERLENDPRFLSSTRKDLPEAHRSLRALFDSSWNLLDDSEKEAVARLSVFRGGFSLAAAQLAFKLRPELLSNLADHCLLEVSPSGRYALPERVRPFAAAKLEENPARRDEAFNLHARYFCRLLKEREKNLMGLEQAAAVAELREEYPNVQRAWDRAVELGWIREIGQASRCIGLYTEIQGLARDWEPRMARALSLVEGPNASRAVEGLAAEEILSTQASLLANQANNFFILGRGGEALDRIEKSLALFKKAGNRSGAAYSLVRLAVFLGPEAERRRPALEEAVALYESLGDVNGAAWARRNLGYLLCRQGNPKEGKPMIEAALAVFRKLGNQRELAWSLNSLGQLALEAGQAEEGTKGLREAKDIFLALGDLATAAWTLNTLGAAAMKRRAWAEARPATEESLKLFGQVRHFRGRSQSLRNLCEIYAGLGDMATAFKALDQVILDAQTSLDWAGQAGALMQKGQLLARQEKFEDAVGLMLEGQAAFAKAGSDLGQALAMESQACTRLKQGQPAVARGLLQEALRTLSLIGARDGEARLDVRLGNLDFAEGRPEGGEGWYQKALKLSRQNRPGDYTLGALLGLAAVFQKQGRNLEALHLALVCERALFQRLMPVSEAEFYDELGQKSEGMLSQLGSKLMLSVIEEARAKIAKQDARALLKESVEKCSS